jgi:hypothetical protein
LELLPRFEQRFAAITAGAGNPFRGRHEHAAILGRDKRRSQGGMLGPVKEVIEFTFVCDGLLEVDHRLSCPHLNFSAELQTGLGQVNGKR